jgi:hypothetical protein
MTTTRKATLATMAALAALPDDEDSWTDEHNATWEAVVAAVTWQRAASGPDDWYHHSSLHETWTLRRDPDHGGDWHLKGPGYCTRWLPAVFTTQQAQRSASNSVVLRLADTAHDQADAAH